MQTSQNVVIIPCMHSHPNDGTMISLSAANCGPVGHQRRLKLF